MERIYELKVVREPTGYRVLKRFQASEDVYRMFCDRFERSDREEFIVVLLDNKNRMLEFNVVSTGSLTASIVHPREVFKPAILTSAAGIILTHNHPSGDPAPSSEDVEITKRLKEVGEMMGIRVLDHVIVGDNRYFSFSDKGMI